MRITQFHQLLAKEEQDHVIKNCNLVVDAQNYFYNIYELNYKRYNLIEERGCQSNLFAMFLKSSLLMFKTANIKCYFVFNGASKDVEKRWKKNERDMTMWEEDSIPHIFVTDICRQVLEELGFDYVICQFEAKIQCAILANKLQCPVLTDDIEVGILSNSYVKHLRIDNGGLICKFLRFNNFLEKYELSQDTFPIFILLTDEAIYPEEYFAKVLNRIEAPSSLPEKYIHIFKWLSRTPMCKVINEILESVAPDERETIILKDKEIRALFTLQSSNIPCQYLLERNEMCVTENDPQWFEKGIALRYISIHYIKLYTDGIIDNSWAFQTDSVPDAILLSADIIKYAFNLMTNYSKNSFVIRRYNGNKIEISTKMPDVPKPNYTVSNVVFENGWTRITQLNLFKHFLSGTVRNIDFEPVCELPGNARMLVIVLIYMAHKSETWGEREAYSVILCFITLCDNNDIMKRQDRHAAHMSLTPYMDIHNIPWVGQTYRGIVYSLFQFQHCLEHLNHLNALCGFPYEPTVYSRSYNAEHVCLILSKLKSSKINAFLNVSQLLDSAPTVMTFFKKIADVHKKIIAFKN